MRYWEVDVTTMSDPVRSETGAFPGTPPLEASGSPQVDGSEVVLPEGSSRAGRVSSDPVVFGVTARLRKMVEAPRRVGRAVLEDTLH